MGNKAAQVNTLARWCAMEDETCLPSEKVDLFVLFGGAVIGFVETLAHAMQADVARRYAIVGGRGRATFQLDASMETELARWDDALGARPCPGTDSEAQMLDAVLRQRFGLRADFLETRSTNCGNNIEYLMDMLEGHRSIPQSIVLCQDAVMQRRMDATWRRWAERRPAFAQTKVFDQASYTARVRLDDGELAWEKAPEGMWPISMYPELLGGEVRRLTDDERGYGPRGQDFVVHVDIPDDVRHAAESLGL